MSDTIKTTVDPRILIEILSQEVAELRMQIRLIQAAEIQKAREAQETPAESSSR